jgi:cell division protein FtsW (lipid II flippase)
VSASVVDGPAWGAGLPGLEVRRRSARQLMLIVLAIVLSVGGYVLAAVGVTGSTPANVPAFVGLTAGAFLLAHVLTVRFAPGADPVVLPTAAVLTGIGYAEIFRIAPSLATQQFYWLLVGVAFYCLTLVLVRDHRRLESLTYTIGLVGIGMLLLPIVPGAGGLGGYARNGARLWFRIGPISFQPAEIGKVLIVIFLASYLNAKKELLALATRRVGPIHVPEPRHLAPLAVAWGVSLAILFAENDLGSSLLFFGIFVVMLWLATGRGAYLGLGVVLFAGGAFLGYALVPHVQTRVAIWIHALDPKYVNDTGYQLAQSWFAMATGGVSGTGLGQGHPRLIPFAYNDFIFSAIGEELGLLGATVVLLLFVVLVARGLKASSTTGDGFGKLLAAGLATVVAIQTFVIVGGVTRVIPLTGVTLPFVSYGGSSLVTNFVLLALLVRVSAGARPAGRHRLDVVGRTKKGGE